MAETLSREGQQQDDEAGSLPDAAEHITSEPLILTRRGYRFLSVCDPIADRTEILTQAEKLWSGAKEDVTNGLDATMLVVWMRQCFAFLGEQPTVPEAEIQGLLKEGHLAEARRLWRFLERDCTTEGRMLERDRLSYARSIRNSLLQADASRELVIDTGLRLNYAYGLVPDSLVRLFHILPQ